jgi:hypothetical protein
VPAMRTNEAAYGGGIDDSGNKEKKGRQQPGMSSINTEDLALDVCAWGLVLLEGWRTFRLFHFPFPRQGRPFSSTGPTPSPNSAAAHVRGPVNAPRQSRFSPFNSPGFSEASAPNVASLPPRNPLLELVGTGLCLKITRAIPASAARNGLGNPLRLGVSPIIMDPIYRTVGTTSNHGWTHLSRSRKGRESGLNSKV